MKTLRYFAFAVVLLASAHAQVSISASAVTDSFETPIPAARLCFTPVNAANAPSGFRVGSVQVVPYETCQKIVMGVLVPGLHVAPSPTGMYYHIYAKSANANTILRDFGMTPITGTTWTLDTYDPSLAVLPVSTISMGTTTTLPPTSGASCNITGSGPFLLNCGVPQGIQGVPGTLTNNSGFTAGGDSAVNGSFITKRLEGVRTVPDGFATVAAAIGDLGSSPGAISGKCGATVNDNISITLAPIDFAGTSGIGTSVAASCFTLQPSGVNDLFTVDATATGNTGTTSLRNFTPNCPSGTCGNIVTITGSQTTNQPNDYLVFKNISTPQTTNSAGTAGFANGFKITGRTIWSMWDNVRMNGTRGDGFNFTSTGGAVGPINALYIHNSQAYGNYGYGMRWNTSGGVTLSEANAVTNTNIESNGQNTALSPCAGVLINGVYITSFAHDNFESNCPSTTDANAAHVRITGTNPVPQFVNFIDNDWNAAASTVHYGIYADAQRSGGVIFGNRFAGSSMTPVHIAANSMDSLWEIGVNQNIGQPDIVADGGGNTHVTSPAYGVLGAYTLIGPGTGCPTSGGTFDLVNTCSTGYPLNNLGLNGASATWSNFIKGITGQFLFFQALTANGYTLTNAAGGTGQMFTRDGANITLGQNDSIAFRRDSNGNWQEVFRDTLKDLAPRTYTVAGLQLAKAHTVIGSCTLASGTCSVTLTGSAVYTSATTYICTANDQSAASATRVTQTSGSAFTLTGSGSDGVQFSCAGN